MSYTHCIEKCSGRGIEPSMNHLIRQDIEVINYLDFSLLTKQNQMTPKALINTNSLRELSGFLKLV